MHRILAAVTALATAALALTGLTGTAASADAATRRTGLGIRLADAPKKLADDPRARSYVIDHVAPGASFQRHVVVSNDTGAAAHVDLYAAAASVQGGRFLTAAGRDQNELTGWIRVSPASVDLAQGESTTATVSFDVPTSASRGERYAIIYAELPPRPDSNGIGVAARTGVRVYLDVGFGAPPPSDFTISTLTAKRLDDGSPAVTASVKNIGGRALDMSGQLWLRNGPGGLSAGPFTADAGTTLAIGAEAPVTVKLDKALPAGPWLAHLEMRSGLIKHAVEATITFPTGAGSVGKAVKARAVPLTRNKRVLGLVAGSLILLVVLGILFTLFVMWRRRKRDEEPEAGPAAVPPPRGGVERSHRVRR